MCYHCCRTARQELPKSKRGIKKKRDAAALLACLDSEPTTFPRRCQAFSNMPSRGIAMLSGSSPLLAAHMTKKKKRGLDWLCWQQLCQQISNGLGRGSRWAAARPTPRPVLLLGLYPDMFPSSSFSVFKRPFMIGEVLSRVK